MMRMLIALLAFAAGPALAAAPVSVSKQQLEGGAHVLSHEVVVDAPVEKVWKAISTADGWESWAVPVAWEQSPDVLETSYDKSAKPGDKTTIRQQTPAEAAAWRKALLPVHQQMEARIGKELLNAIAKEASKP